MIMTQYISLFALLLLYSGCSKLLDTGAPPTQVGGTVYASDGTAAAVLTGIYQKMSSGGPLTGDESLSYLCGLSADEFTLHAENDLARSFYRNDIRPAEMPIWTSFYEYIRYANVAIEGLTASSTLTPSVKQQLTGEARFIRAFCYFYLVNLFGDVPLQVSSDYKENSTKSRTSIAHVYRHIVYDLQEAQRLLKPGYLEADVLTPSMDRLRPNKWSATALLARVQLFLGNWAEAEANAGAVIEQRSLYDTVRLTDVFTKSNKEAIWQLQPVNKDYPMDADLFIAEHRVTASPFLLSAFEKDDQRKSTWLYDDYPGKYRPVPQYLVILRLAELYLVRAEARVLTGNLEGARGDLNLIRRRAGLGPVTANEQAALLKAIEQERQTELFAEFGHRWLDLKRNKTVHSIMPVVAGNKGGEWKAYKQWYPILAGDLVLNPNLVQNEGY